jgi:hypothetical protein
MPLRSGVSPLTKGAPPAAGCPPVYTAVNTEWGAFCSEHVPRSSADDALDAASVWPGEQHFEKAVGGYYLGEVVRRCGQPFSLPRHVET